MTRANDGKPYSLQWDFGSSGYGEGTGYGLGYTLAPQAQAVSEFDQELSTWKRVRWDCLPHNHQYDHQERMMMHF